MNQSFRGKAVILGIFLLALVLSGFAWWYQLRKGSHCREFLGTDAVQLIRQASRVDLMRLERLPGTTAGPGSTAATIELPGGIYRVTERTDITPVPGLLHARHALLQDVNYQWARPPGDCASDWAFALQFSSDTREAVLAFDPACNLIGVGDTDRTAPFDPVLMRTYTEKSREWELRAGGEPGRERSPGS